MLERRDPPVGGGRSDQRDPAGAPPRRERRPVAAPRTGAGGRVRRERGPSWRLMPAGEITPDWEERTGQAGYFLASVTVAGRYRGLAFQAVEPGGRRYPPGASRCLARKRSPKQAFCSGDDADGKLSRLARPTGTLPLLVRSARRSRTCRCSPSSLAGSRRNR